MKKYAFMFKLKEERVNEYIEKHKNIWDEMRQVLKEAGRVNYSIWHKNNIVFGYYEVEDQEISRNILAGSNIVKKWNAIIADMVVNAEDTSNYAQEMEMIFNLD